MGTILKYIADHALYPCGGTVCHHCECSDKPIFSYFGEIINPNTAKDSQLALEEPDISELCVDCINGGYVRRSDVYEFETTIQLYSNNKDYSLRELNYLPYIPLFLQGTDWPMCCGEWSEYLGYPESNDKSIQLPNKYQYWQRGPKEWTADYKLVPESLREISIFRCSKCGSKYFTWQFT